MIFAGISYHIRSGDHLGLENLIIIIYSNLFTIKIKRVKVRTVTFSKMTNSEYTIDSLRPIYSLMPRRHFKGLD